MHALYVLRYAKRHVSGQSDVKQCKIKLIALAIIELRFPKGRQAGRQAGRLKF